MLQLRRRRQRHGAERRARRPRASKNRLGMTMRMTMRRWGVAQMGWLDGFQERLSRVQGAAAADDDDADADAVTAQLNAGQKVGARPTRGGQLAVTVHSIPSFCLGCRIMKKMMRTMMRTTRTTRTRVGGLGRLQGCCVHGLPCTLLRARARQASTPSQYAKPGQRVDQSAR